MKSTVDEELWYGAGNDEQAEEKAAKSMAAQVGRVIGAKPFPIAAQRLIALTQDPSCELDEIVATLESDPALSARLLRLVNAVGYSLRTSCTSVRHAAALVGIEKLHQVASTAAILDMFDDGGGHAATVLEHATIVGSLCRYLAFHFGLPPDELFTCGFLHDIGKLMLLDTESDYRQLLEETPAAFDQLYVVERARYGFDHALMAGHVLAAWHIPEPVPKVVAWHHHVTRAYADSTLTSQMVNTLRLADALSYVLNSDDPQAEVERLARSEAASYLNISEVQLASMWEEAQALTERARCAFRGEEPPPSYRSTETSEETGPAVSLRPTPSLSASLRPRARDGSIGTARRFPCVVCTSPSYAQTCSACGGYVCPEHVVGGQEWCELCFQDYKDSGIPRINPTVSAVLGATVGALVAATLIAANAASGDRPARAFVGPTLIFMLLGILGGVAHRWARHFWFLRHRPHRRFSQPPATAQEVHVASGLAQQPIESTDDEIRALKEHRRVSQMPGPAVIGGSLIPPSRKVAPLPPSPRVAPPAPLVPKFKTPLIHSVAPPPPSSSGPKLWMSAQPTPVPAAGPADASLATPGQGAPPVTAQTAAPQRTSPRPADARAVAAEPANAQPAKAGAGAPKPAAPAAADTANEAPSEPAHNSGERPATRPPASEGSPKASRPSKRGPGGVKAQRRRSLRADASEPTEPQERVSRSQRARTKASKRPGKRAPESAGRPSREPRAEAEPAGSSRPRKARSNKSQLPAGGDHPHTGGSTPAPRSASQATGGAPIGGAEDATPATRPSVPAPPELELANEVHDQAGGW